MSALPNSSPANSEPTDRTASLRWAIYGLLIAASLGQMAGRVLAVNAVDVIKIEKFLKDKGREDWQKQRPFLSGNDRSRWLTVRALVENGTYTIDGLVCEPNWDTIDMVKHDGHLYSSKPPLLATLIAPQYWVLHKLTGWTLGTHPFECGRILLFINQLLPLALFFCLLAKAVERWGRSDFERVFVMACATFGTFLSTFVIVLNNHLPAAVSTLIATYAALRIYIDGERHWKYFAIAGGAAAFTAACELPALSFCGLLGLLLLYHAPLRTLAAGAPAALVVVAAFFGTNYAAHGSWAVAYAHREEGENWYKFTYECRGRTIQSYWHRPQGVDAGEPNAALYATHALVGHHGIFSLTPVWLLSFLGMFLLIARRDEPLRVFAALVLICTLVCLVFYLKMPQLDRNYGGMTSGFRWMFWFAPLWLLTMLPAARWANERAATRWVAYTLLGLSALSAAYPTWNPWVSPWLQNGFAWLGWI